VRSDGNMMGYWRRKEETRDVVFGPWIRLGDVLRQDGDGFFHYIGRADDMFKVGAQWVSPVQVEGILVEHPAVREAAVVGVPDDELGQEVAAFVVGDVLPAELRTSPANGSRPTSTPAGSRSWTSCHGARRGSSSARRSPLATAFCRLGSANCLGLSVRGVRFNEAPTTISTWRFVVPLTQTQFADEIAERSGASRADVKRMLTALEEVVLDQIADAEKVKIGTVVQLEVRVRPATSARPGRNPATGEEIMISAKPASVAVKARPLAKAKAAAPSVDKAKRKLAK
jgi:nucleoid DNA-binding protein